MRPKGRTATDRTAGVPFRVCPVLLPIISTLSCLALAPLRERKTDIPSLAAHFLERACKELNKTLGLISSEALAALKTYDWPGNVRELRNVVERAVITARNGPIVFELPSAPLRGHDVETQGESAPIQVQTEEEVRDAERANVLAALNKTRWKVYGPGGAAELLGLRPGTLAARMKKLGRRRPQAGFFSTSLPMVCRSNCNSRSTRRVMRTDLLFNWQHK